LSDRYESGEDSARPTAKRRKRHESEPPSIRRRRAGGKKRNYSMDHRTELGRESSREGKGLLHPQRKEKEGVARRYSRCIKQGQVFVNKVRMVRKKGMRMKKGVRFCGRLRKNLGGRTGLTLRGNASCCRFAWV